MLPQQQVRRRWYQLRWWQFVLLLLAMLVGWYVIYSWTGHRRLQTVMSELDKLGIWRHADIKAKLMENGAGVGLPEYLNTLARQLPLFMPTRDEIVHIDPLRFFPNHLMHPETKALLRKRYQDNPDILARLKQVLTFPTQPLQGDFDQTAGEWLVRCRYHDSAITANAACREQMWLCLQNKDYVTVFELLLVQQKIAINLLKEPISIEQMFGLSLLANLLDNVGRVFALSELNDTELEQLSKQLQSIDLSDAWHRQLVSSAGDTLQFIEYLSKPSTKIVDEFGISKPDEVWDQWRQYFELILLKSVFASARFRAEMMEWHHKLYMRAGDPLHEQYVELLAQHEQLKQLKKDKLDAKRMITPPMHESLKTTMKLIAALRCSQVAVAAERFRLRHQRWPQKQEELVPTLLSQVMMDPFDNKPLRLKHVDDGLVIYSIGGGLGKDVLADDDGDVMSSEDGPIPKDNGIKLWNPTHRRLPAKPLRKFEHEGNKIEW
jgi:hypothetical protein